MKINCDFCGSPHAKYRFPHRLIVRKRPALDIEPGYFYACIDCTIMFEDGQITDLVKLAIERPEYSANKGNIVELRLELAAIYNQVSRKLREPI